MDRFSFLTQSHPQYIETLYRQYREDPDRVEPGWRRFFEGFEFALQEKGAIAPDHGTEHIQKEIKVLNLIQAYRTRGHLFTRTNPVRTRRQYRPTLDIENFGLQEKDLDTVFHAGEEIGIGPATLRDILAHLNQTYCHSVGAEFMFIREPARLAWLKRRMESTRNTPNFSIEEKRHILEKLNQAVVFEKFLHSRYVGQKRFSLQGHETLIPGLDAIIEKGSRLGIAEFVIGMPHRGRLNVLANILKKTYEEIFSEFEGEVYADSVFAGDVKYHLGYTSRVKTRQGNEVTLHLAPNPSHLEAVDPVVEGMARAKIDQNYQGDASRVVPILIHGDAAMAGQGVVYEVIQMSLLKAFHTGGTIHLIINNQLGFTTNFQDGRSSTYSTDVAKVTLSPVFHVNADDVEAVVYTIQLAMEYRQTFHTDVFIDLLGYRKYGHNESDEPRFTQPRLYRIIARHPDPREIYIRKLQETGELERGLAEEMERNFKQLLQEKLETVKEKKKPIPSHVQRDVCDESQRREYDFESASNTQVPRQKLLELGEKVFTLPQELRAFNKIRRLYESRKQRWIQEHVADWAIAEFMAYATLLDEGVPIRLCGQDTERGTFSHRHAVVLDQETEEKYVPLRQAERENARFQIYNSLLSEYGVLGFEYGYACSTPQGLTIWEAQFGDFANGAQIVIDQFIVSSEAKWKRMNGIVLYLPHGYEGQGPEHSSARIERYLTLCAHNNMVVANCTTPANFFHLLRRHMKLPFRIPLVIFTPKSLLRHPRCISSFEEFTDQGFQPLIDDSRTKPAKVKKVLLCSGKIYYELLEKQEQDGRDDVAIVRLEQLYPLPEKGLKKIARRYRHAEFVWVQEEPENMGALPFLLRKLKAFPFRFVAREESATPATGIYRQHVREQQDILRRAFE